MLRTASIRAARSTANARYRRPFVCKARCVIVCGSESQDQASTRSKADRASPRRIIDQSPASRPKRRVTVIATEAVSVATPDFFKATGTVFSSPILSPRSPTLPRLEGTRGNFWPELCFAFKIRTLLQSGHINTTANGCCTQKSVDARNERGRQLRRPI